MHVVESLPEVNVSSCDLSLRARQRRVARAAAIAAATLVLAVAPGWARGGGGGGGGGNTGGTNPLPTEPPAPGVLMRESFGAAELLRPKGGNGTLREVYTHTSLAGFWIEWPGSKDTAWSTRESTQTWRFAGCTDDPNEMPSPIQVTYGNGCLSSEWFDGLIDFPTLLVPFNAPATAYAISLDAWPAPIPGAYVAIGLTESNLLESNLATSASVWLAMLPGPHLDNFTILYELRLNGRTGPILAAGETAFMGWNEIRLTYDPVAEVVGASINGIDLGSYPAPLRNPRSIGIEGVGVADNFVVRELP